MKQKQFITHLLMILLAGIVLTNCSKVKTESIAEKSEGNEALTIWWEKGYYTQEDEAIKTIIADWQSNTNQSVEIRFVHQDDVLKNINSAFQNGDLPDILFSILTDEILSDRWASEGQLADVSDVIAPVKDFYSPAALDSVFLYNDITQAQSSYAIPLKQRSTHIHYWRPLLEKTGSDQAALPTEWDAFWSFWKQAQDALRAQGNDEIYAFGLPMSSESSDTHYAFEYILNAYNVELWDKASNFQGDDAKVRQGIIDALRWYTVLYKDGYVPPAAVDWTNGDNNTDFLNQGALMVVNPTLSIPASQREDEDIYKNQIVTTAFPLKPDDTPLESLVAVKQVVLFESSAHQEAAKDFLAYLIQPEQLGPYLESSLGRYFPVMPQLASEPFWNDPSDPHIFNAAKQFQNNTYANPRSLDLLPDAVWGRAMERILVDGVSVEVATDEAIAQIKEIFQSEMP